MRPNRAFTLVELLLAMAVAALVLAGSVGALIYTARGYRREDLQMVRSRVAQQILARLDDDIAHVVGWLRLTPEAIAAVGYSGSVRDFLLEPRRAAHILNAYTVGTVPPDFSELLPFEERWRFFGGRFFLDSPRCRYLQLDPRPGYDIFPSFAMSATFLVRKPADDPSTVYLPMALGRGVVPPETVLWAFVRKTQGVLAAGTVLRWSASQGAVDFTREARLLGDVRLRDQWLHVTQPGGQKGSEVFEVLLEAELEALPERSLPFESPPFRTRRTMTAGL